MQPGLFWWIFAKIFFWTKILTRRLFQLTMKGQDPDCGQLEAEFSYMFFFVFFLPDSGGRKNELLEIFKIYGWNMVGNPLFFSHR